MIRPVDSGEGLDLYGSIQVSEREAHLGGRKLVAIAHDRKKKTFFVNIPPGVAEGTTLRLRGMGQQTTAGVRGDLYLKVQVES
jgi:DnaJ-class molecular chaperone